MPPLITPRGSPGAGARSPTTPRSRRWSSAAFQARQEHFGDSTDMCSLVNAKSGGCAEDCGFCAQSRFAEAATPMHAMMTPEQILEHARAAEAAGAHRFCMVTQGQGLTKRDFQNVIEGAKLVARAHQPQALRLDRPHLRRSREGAEGGRHPAGAPQRGDRGELLPGGLHHGPLRGAHPHDRGGEGGGPRDLRRRHPQPRGDRGAAGGDGVPAR